MFDREQNQNRIVECDVNSAFGAVIQAAEHMKGFKVSQRDINARRIVIDVFSITSFTWGESVTVTLNPVSGTRTEISVSSKSKFGLEIMAGLKNRANVESLLNEINRYLPPMSATQPSPGQFAAQQSAPQQSAPQQFAAQQSAPQQYAPQQFAAQQSASMNEAGLKDSASTGSTDNN